MTRYTLTGKRTRGRWRHIRPVCIFLCVLCMLALLVNGVLLPKVRSLCEHTLRNRLSRLASEEAYSLLSEGGYTYESFIRLNYDETGALRSASVDTVTLSLLKAKLSLAVLSHLCAEELTVSVPVSALLGILLFSGVSGEIPVTATVMPSATASILSVFEEAGINQTRHAVTLSLCFFASYLLPTGKEDLTFRFDLPLAETVIVGDVPDSLTQITRLTDDVTEYEIDDAVDFGNVVP